MAKYLVTGGCGFIGTHLCDKLINQGHNIIILDNLSSGRKSTTNPLAKLYIGDINDKELLNKLISEVDGCFHLAAVASIDRSINHWRDTHLINQAGTVSIFEASAQLASPIPIVYASSAAVYGESEESILFEDTKCNPLTAYGVDKLGCELQAKVAGLIHKVPTLGCRLFNVYGPGQNPTSSHSGVISQFIEKVKNKESITIYGDGNQVRDFIYIKDVTHYLTKAMPITSTNAPVINICSATPYTIKDLAHIIFETFGYKVDITYKQRKQGDIRLSLGSKIKLLKEFDQDLRHPLPIALNEMINK